MIEKIKSEQVDFLFDAMLTIKTREEFYNLFDDLCTIAEVSEMSKRLQAAKMLKNGVVYNAISEATGLSTATISRVNRCLKYGSGGYQKVLESMNDEG